MKLLLLTDVPPCQLYSGALVTLQLCKFMPKGSICCAAVVNPGLTKAKTDPSLDWMPTEYFVKPREQYLGAKIPSGVYSYLAENYIRPVQLARMADRIADFARGQGVTDFWCILQGQSMARLATMVAERLDVPLLTQVWDPFSYWLNEHVIDVFSQKRLLADFDRALASSKRCATASWAMSEDYEKRYGIETIPLIAGIDKALAKAPVAEAPAGDEFVIALAGQIYASVEWFRLIEALTAMDWKVDGRRIVLNLLGSYMPPSLTVHSPLNIRLLGWHSQAATIDILSRADLLYIPYWFDAWRKESSSLCFPSKFVTYLAAAKPILIHAPAYASPSRFGAQEKCAVVCDSHVPEDIAAVITKVAMDKSEYVRLCAQGARTFQKYFTLETMRSNFGKFLGADDGFLS